MLDILELDMLCKKENKYPNLNNKRILYDANLEITKDL